MSNIPDIPEHEVGSTQVQDDALVRDRSTTTPASPSSRKRGTSNASEATSSGTGRLRSASQRILEANIPSGMWSATGSVVSKAPSLGEIRRGSYGTRRESDAGTAHAQSASQSSNGPVREELGGQDGGTTSLSKTDRISDADGFPSNLFGRPALDDQSFGANQKESVKRVPKLAVRRKDSQEDIGSEVFQDAVESQTVAGQPPKIGREASKEPFPDLGEDSDLEDIDPQPKRYSKNIDAMLGRTPPTKVVPTTDRESSETGEITKPVPNEEGVYPNGYTFPKPKPWTEATMIGFKAFLRFTFTLLGFLIVLYGLNVVAWGGMLFLLLCNASPVMCHLGNGTYDCNDIDSPRRVWVEIDSQILNALFCVTGFGLIPWRFRDLYYWIKWRIGKKESGLRKLAGYHNGWFRLPDSDHLPLKDFRESQLEEDSSNPALPFPLKKTPAPPLTGARAPPTAFWKMDFVIWAFIWNTFLQAVLSGFMWGLNRYDRPSWSTGLFVALACIVAACGGGMQFMEGKNIKKVEGVPIEVEQEYRDVEKGMKQKDKDNIQDTKMTETSNNGNAPL